MAFRPDMLKPVETANIEAPFYVRNHLLQLIWLIFKKVWICSQAFTRWPMRGGALRLQITLYNINIKKYNL